MFIRFRAVRVALLALLLGLGGMTGALAQSTEDAPNTADALPELRDIGQVLLWQQIFEGARPASMPLGPLTALGGIDDWAQVEGAGSRTWYSRRGAARQMESTYRRQRELLERAGFEIRAAGFTDSREGSGVGSWPWIELYLSVNGLPEGAPLAHMADAVAQGALVASRDEPEGLLWAVVLVLQPGAREIGMQLDLVQTLRTAPPPPIGMQALGRAMATHGHAVLDGLHFDADGALLPESEPVLTVVGRFLQANLRQDFRIVGHTEETESLAGAARQSQAQAEAVVSALVERHGASRDRLRAFGVGPLAPLFPNDAEAARNRNRRVELVVGP